MDGNCLMMLSKRHLSKEPTKLTKILNDLTESYGKENHGSSGRIRLLSTVASHVSNKELKAFPCSDYELTESRRHAKFIGAGVTPPKHTRVTRYKISVEDLAVMVNFLHHPDVTRSSHRMACCEGKKSSWLLDLLEEQKQPVMWLKDSKNHLYAKYKAECLTSGRRPISETKFHQGLDAGNFREMVQMVGLCNICDEIRAHNWDDLDDIINKLSQELSHKSFNEIPSDHDSQHHMENDEETEFVSVTDKMKVVMEDITDQDTEYQQWNLLPKDSPVNDPCRSFS